MNDLLLVAALGVTLGLGAFFAGIEIGLMSLTRVRLQHLSEHGNWRALIVSTYLQRPDRYLTVTMLGSCLCDLSTTAILTHFIVGWFPLAAVGIALAIILSFLLVHLICYTAARSLFYHYPMRLTLGLATVMQFSYAFCSPLVIVVEYLSRRALQIFKSPLSPAHLYILRDELLAIAKESTDTGGFTAEEIRGLTNIFEFNDLTARELMLPLSSITMITQQSPIMEVLDLAGQRGTSFLPVVDNVVKIVGLVYVNDILFSNQPCHDKTAASFLRYAIFVRPNERVDTILQKLRANRQEIAIVTDSIGHDLGIITMKDILDRIMGEIER